MSRTRQLLCVFYGLIALIALVATWSQNLLYFTGPDSAGFGQYVQDLKVNGAARSFTVDIGLFQNSEGMLEVKVRPQSDFNGIFSSLVFALRYDKNSDVQLGVASQPAATASSRAACNRRVLSMWRARSSLSSRLLVSPTPSRPRWPM